MCSFIKLYVCMTTHSKSLNLNRRPRIASYAFFSVSFLLFRIKLLVALFFLNFSVFEDFMKIDIIK